MGCGFSAPAHARGDGRRDVTLEDGATRRTRARGRGRAREGARASDARAGAEGRARVKLVLLGASAAGKTSVSARFARGTFSSECKATVGAAFASATREVDGGRVKFEIWDTAGQERYASLAPLYYRGASAAMIVFDVTSRESFERARYWAEELRRHGDPECATTLVGNKTDLEERATTTSEAEALAEEFSMRGGYVECSARTGAGVAEAFEAVGRDALARVAGDAARDERDA